MKKLPVPFDYLITPVPWRLKALYQEANLLFSHQKWANAASIFLYICTHFPQFRQARFKLSACLMQLNNWPTAQQQLEHLLNVKQPDPDIMCNLAICHWQQRHFKSALRLFKFNIKHFPYHLETLENLASFFIKFNRIPQAMVLYRQILGRYEKRADIRFNLAALLQQQGIYDEAIIHYKTLLQQHHNHPDYLYNLGAIYYSIKEFKTAQNYWQQSLKQNPNQKSLAFMLCMLDKQDIDPKAHQAYVESLFNSYASYYENHLLSELHYHLPEFLANYLSGKSYQKVLEIGCGTGLCGRALQSITSVLVGVDVSKEMLEKAKSKKSYTQLIHQDALDFLKPKNNTFDLIVAMDVLPYIYQLAELMHWMTRALNSNGELLISIETNDQQGQQLEATGRFSVSVPFIKKLFLELGLEIVFEQERFARTQDQRPVMERIFHLKRNG